MTPVRAPHLADKQHSSHCGPSQRIARTNRKKSGCCTITPDWVCEVLSPSTRRLDQGEKRDLYAREGVGHLWFIGPDARTLEDFELREEHWLLLATLASDAPVSHPLRRHHLPARRPLARGERRREKRMMVRDPGTPSAYESPARIEPIRGRCIPP
ncbi:MAG: Uma2 family endonuclease [Paracoccaceae bacterium]|nr:Uma2 family endonuclease [Paracoccaceae bacterium]